MQFDARGALKRVEALQARSAPRKEARKLLSCHVKRCAERFYSETPAENRRISLVDMLAARHR